MISIYKIKPLFQNVLRPLLRKLYQLKISANQITISAVFLSLIIGIMFWFADAYPIFWLVLPLGLLIRMALNALDGMMAREYHQQSKLGEVLNELGDVFSDFVIFLPLIKYEISLIIIIVIFICLSIINEFAGVLCKVISNTRAYDGPMGKSDRAFFLGLYGILNYFGIYNQSISPYIFSVIVFLIIVSTIIRVKRGLKNAQ